MIFLVAMANFWQHCTERFTSIDWSEQGKVIFIYNYDYLEDTILAVA